MINSLTNTDEVWALMEAAQNGDTKAQSIVRNNAGDLEDYHGIHPDDMNFSKHWQNANLSLLPSGLLKQVQDQPRQADADYSLLPRGWQEGVVQ